MNYVKNFNEYNVVNEGFGNWLATFLLLTNLGLVPLSIKTADAQTKKEFVEGVSPDKVDAAKFVDFLKKNYSDEKSLETIFTDFLSKNKEVKSSYNDVSKLIQKDGKTFTIKDEHKDTDISNVDIYKFTPVNYLTDLASVIDDSKEPYINNLIYDYEKKTTVEVCVLTVPKLGDNDNIDDYAQQQFQRIGVGKKPTNNGVMIVFSIEDRKWRIHTGYGVEALLTDYECSNIGRNILVPNFKKGDYYSGVVNALNEISAIINKNPQDILKYKKDLEEARDKEMKESMRSFAINGVIGLILLTLIVLLVKTLKKKWDSATELSDEIDAKLKLIDGLITKAKLTGVEEVDSLLNKVKELIEKRKDDILDISKSSERPKPYQLLRYTQFLTKSESRFKLMQDIYDDFDDVYLKWDEQKGKLDEINSAINKHSDIDLLNSISLGLAAFTSLLNTYGERSKFDEKDLKEKVSEMDRLIDKIDSTYNKSVDDAHTLFDQYSGIEAYVKSSVSSVKSRLSTYKNAEDRIKNWKSLVNSALSDMNRYKRWARSGEESSITDKVESFKSVLGGNILKVDDELSSLLSSIENMERKWRGRKEDEEEEERRKKRREEESRRSSYSISSSSGSSFSGFGGGSSGGGGASGSW